MSLNKIFIILLSLLLFSCSREKSIVKQKEKSTLSDYKYYKHILELPSDLRTFIFFDTAKIYSSPDTLSQVVKTLKFSDSQYDIDEYIIHNNEYWYKLRGWNPDFKSGGYIKAEVMSNFYTSQSKYNLGFLGKIISNGETSKIFSLKLFDTSNYKIIQEYNIPNYYKYHNIDVIYESEHSLKGVNYIFYYKTYEDECPGSHYEEIIVSTKNKLIKLWCSDDLNNNGKNYEDIEDEQYVVYIPISTKNKDVLAPWGNFQNILNNDLTLNIIDCSQIDVPITELIVLKHIREYVNNIKEENLKFYRWNGKSLKLIKEENIN